MIHPRLAGAAVAFLVATTATAKEPIRLPNNPALSPDGKTVAFDHLGDIWTVPTAGGTAKPLTASPARDTSPKFSPDGKEIAFVSDRDGGRPQIFVMPAGGGTPKQVTHHTEGYALYGWADADRVLAGVNRDASWTRRGGNRFAFVNVRTRKADDVLFDDYGATPSLSPDGTALLFTREGAEWWRKGYRGSQASQLWRYDLKTKAFDQPLQAALVLDIPDVRRELGKLAEHIKDILAKKDGDELSLADFRGPSGVADILGEELGKRGLKVKKVAKFDLQGSSAIARDRGSR